MTTIETERLILRPMRDRDAMSIAELIGNWNVCKMLSRSPYPYALSDAQEFIASRTTDDDITTRVFAIQLKDGSEHAIGGVGIHGEEEAEGEAELGYWIGEPYWGKGLVKEATIAALRHAFTTMDKAKLVAGHFEDNDASRRILLFLGFVPGGERVLACRSRGMDVKCPQLSLTRDAWKAAQ